MWSRQRASRSTFICHKKRSPKLIGSTRQRVNQILKDYETNSLLKQQYGFILLLDQANFEKLLA